MPRGKKTSGGDLDIQVKLLVAVFFIIALPLILRCMKTIGTVDNRVKRKAVTLTLAMMKNQKPGTSDVDGFNKIIENSSINATVTNASDLGLDVVLSEPFTLFDNQAYMVEYNNPVFTETTTFNCQLFNTDPKAQTTHYSQGVSTFTNPLFGNSTNDNNILAVFSENDIDVQLINNQQTLGVNQYQLVYPNFISVMQGGSKIKYVKSNKSYTGRDKVTRCVYAKGNKSYVKKRDPKTGKMVYREVTLQL